MALALCRFILVLMDEGFNPEDSKIAELFFFYAVKESLTLVLEM